MSDKKAPNVAARKSASLKSLKGMKDGDNKSNLLSSSKRRKRMNGGAKRRGKAGPFYSDLQDSGDYDLDERSDSSPRTDIFRPEITESLLQAFVDRHRQPKPEYRRTYKDDLIRIFEMWPAQLTSSYRPSAVPMPGNCAEENLRIIRESRPPEWPDGRWKDASLSVQLLLHPLEDPSTGFLGYLVQRTIACYMMATEDYSVQALLRQHYMHTGKSKFKSKGVTSPSKT